MTSTVRSHLKDLHALRAELNKSKGARVRVGLLGNKAARFDADWNKEKKNNPTIGLEHEFGVKGDGTSPPLPARSFLRMPLMTRLKDKIQQIGTAVFRALVMKRGIKVALENLGATAENTIQEAFNTGGFGQWQPLSPTTIRRKKSTAILIDTAQMRKAVTSRVVMGRGQP